MSGQIPLIILNEVYYNYPNRTIALKNISLNVYKGELVGIMGMNGAGKTTLIRTLNGLIRPSNGTVNIEGENIENKSIGVLSKKIGLIFQNPEHQIFSNTVEDEIKFSLNSLNLSQEEINLRTDETLKTFNLEKYRDRSPMNLSGGESKKLAIASIICRDPDILVFDEPTLGQDEKEINFFTKLLNLEREQGKTIIIVTHNIEFAMEYIPRIILMANGRIIADGETKKILTNQFLVKKSSLILPQTHKLKLELNKLGIQCPEDIYSKNEMIKFLTDYLNNKSTKVPDVND